jgi:hypothetical protein
MRLELVIDPIRLRQHRPVGTEDRPGDLRDRRTDVGLLAEGYDIEQRRLAGNLPQAFLSCWTDQYRNELDVEGGRQRPNAPNAEAFLPGSAVVGPWDERPARLSGGRLTAGSGFGATWLIRTCLRREFLTSIWEKPTGRGAIGACRSSFRSLANTDDVPYRTDGVRSPCVVYWVQRERSQNPNSHAQNSWFSSSTAGRAMTPRIANTKCEEVNTWPLVLVQDHQLELARLGSREHLRVRTRAAFWRIPWSHARK